MWGGQREGSMRWLLASLSDRGWRGVPWLPDASRLITGPH